MIRTGGIDLGGTKIEAQKFDADWNVADKRRIDTPTNYRELIAAMADQIRWLQEDNPNLPVGIAAAGLANPTSGTWNSANLPANGMPFVQDVAKATGGRQIWLNDCRAFTQAEVVFGAGQSKGTIVGLVLGTGIAGGVSIDGALINHGDGQSGEFGHMPISGEIIAAHSLPIIKCGCGRFGCYETYGSGPGMERLAENLLGRDLTSREIALSRTNPEISHIWEIWCEINAALILTIVTMIDPKLIVLGGGLSKISGIIEDLESALERNAWREFTLPSIRLGARGETAAALGAAYVAYNV
ncbi:MAG: ROK family protein [Rhodobacteraceae bacterium]|jgi:N-acetylglucosamine kinase|nr:ROK family protein [Paracoccaceae bacterium]